MGAGSWDAATYHTTAATRAATKTPDFAYTVSATKAHDGLDAKRINQKPFGKLESRDSADHPESNAVLVSFDVTGSNHSRAIEAQKVLPKLMALLGQYLSDPQLAFAANDDYYTSDANSIQISDFESDIRIDEHLRNIWLIGKGGGNDGESYDLVLYAAARKTALDCLEKRGKKGYLFLYADEPIFEAVDRAQVKAVFGDDLERDIPIAEIIEEARRLYHVFLIWPRGGYDHARRQYVDLFGDEWVLELQDPRLICELIGSTIGMLEKDLAPADAITDLVAVGTSRKDAESVVGVALAKVAKSVVASGSLAKSGVAGATRL